MAITPFSLGTSLSVPVYGSPSASKYAMGDTADENGYLLTAHGIGWAGAPDTSSRVYQKGCIFTETDNSSIWLNVAAATSAAVWAKIL